MKTLYLLRHAKSSWDHPGLRDHQRPLSSRGRRAAPAMGEHMAAQEWVPDLVLCSDAVRTRETWALVETTLGVAAAAHLASLVDYVDLDGHLLLADDPFAGLELDGGTVRPGPGPGLGVARRTN